MNKFIKNNWASVAFASVAGLVVGGVGLFAYAEQPREMFALSKMALATAIVLLPSTMAMHTFNQQSNFNLHLAAMATSALLTVVVGSDHIDKIDQFLNSKLENNHIVLAVS